MSFVKLVRPSELKVLDIPFVETPFFAADRARLLVEPAALAVVLLAAHAVGVEARGAAVEPPLRLRRREAERLPRPPLAVGRRVLAAAHRVACLETP